MTKDIRYAYIKKITIYIPKNECQIKNEDTDTEMYDNTVIDTEKINKNTNKNITNDIAEFQEDDEIVDDDTVFATKTMEMTTVDNVQNEMTEHQVYSLKMAFDEFTIPVDNSDCDILQG